MANEIKARQLIICCDGTNNTLTGGTHDTNVLKVISRLDPDKNGQLLYYDPGVGAPDELPPMGIIDFISRKYERIQGLASGKGIYENIGLAYQFIVENYRDGDEIFLFGFSRGAFTVRSVAGMLNLFGIARPESLALLPTMLSVYFAKNKDPGADPLAKHARSSVAKQIREEFASVHGRDAYIYFVGVWDTVASVGMPFLFATEISSAGSVIKKRFRHIRHALALDEHRATFRPRLYWDNDYGAPQDFKSLRQRWFRGAHSDVGGGYIGKEARLSNQAFEWLMDEAEQCGLRLKTAHAGGNDSHASMKRMVHDQCYVTPYWGVAGLVVRDFKPLHGGNDALVPIAAGAAAEDQAAVSQWSHGFPWAWIALFIGIALVFMLLVNAYAGAALGRTARWYPVTSGQILRGAIEFNWWQLTWSMENVLNSSPERFPNGFNLTAGAKAIFADAGLIVAYSWLLGLFSSYAFARLAGLRQVGDPVPAHLKILGWAPCFMVVADVLENVFTLGVLWLVSRDWMISALLCGLLMALANLAKWIGLGLSLTMIFLSLFKPRLARPRSS